MVSKKYEYIVNKPIRFINHFIIKKDRTTWNGKYIRFQKVTLPDRKQVLKLKDIFTARTNYSEKFCTSGLYLLFFKNIRAYYVGIASMHTKSPEGIESRIKKHIAKINGTNVGVGVNHTEGWREYAYKINQYYKSKNKEYNLEDLFLVTINVRNHHIYKNLFPNEDKKRLEYIEGKLSNPLNPTIKEIIRFLGDNKPNSWKNFNHTNNGELHEHKLIHWNSKNA
tara:strand:- start:418 stop:1089 length:672 start_codon:yes stop_codon:yes gene_type:complete